MHIELDAAEIPPHLQNYFEPVPGPKPKDALGIPWLVAFALRADGWWLRQEIIWHKLAPMPESVTDRCTKAHEQVFLLAKSREYFFDNEAIREPQAASTHERAKYGWNGRTDDNSNGARTGSTFKRMAASGEPIGTIPADGYRNKRSVWTLAPEQFYGSHYAVMPTKLVEPCVLAGTSAKGCCAKCGSPYERIVEREREGESLLNPAKLNEMAVNGAIKGGVNNRRLGPNVQDSTKTLGWQPTCRCNADIAPCTVLDPFFGSGTVGAVALKHGRRFVGIDLDERNLALARKRIEQSQPMLLEVT